MYIGVGYTFTVVRSNQIGMSSQPIRQLVEQYIPDAEILSSVGAEQTFRLPFSASHCFMNLFTELDKAKSRLGIAEYGISVTTLEEVFIRVGKNTDDPRERTSLVSDTTKLGSSNLIESKHENVESSATIPVYSTNEDDFESRMVPQHSIERMYFTLHCVVSYIYYY